MSCASCHRPELAFSDGIDRSIDRSGSEKVKRNAPGLLQSVYQQRFFYDSRAKELAGQIDHVVFSPQEFNSDYAHIIDLVKGDSAYVTLFWQAFKMPEGSEIIQAANIRYALAAFVSSLGPYNSAFDRYVRGLTANLHPDAYAGFNLFTGKAQCANCHFPPLFNGTVPPKYRDTESEVLGVLSHFDTLQPTLDPDWGRGALMPVSVWKGAFKTPSLRNVAKTAPYMHNGAFRNLDEVLEFYNRGGGKGMGLRLDNQTLSPDGLGLTDTEKKQIIKFLESLSDED